MRTGLRTAVIYDEQRCRIESDDTFISLFSLVKDNVSFHRARHMIIAYCRQQRKALFIVALLTYCRSSLFDLLFKVHIVQ